MSHLILAVFMIMLAGCTSSPTYTPIPAPVTSEPDPTIKMAELWRGASNDVHNQINQFLGGPSGDCQSDTLKEALAFTDALASAVSGPPVPGQLSRLQDTAAWHLDIADAAASHGCPEIAKTTYQDVIRTYVGSGYAAQRQRAEIALADLRAKSQ